MMVYVSEYISFLMIKMVDRGFKLYNPEYTNLTFLLEVICPQKVGQVS